MWIQTQVHNGGDWYFNLETFSKTSCLIQERVMKMVRLQQEFLLLTILTQLIGLEHQHRQVVVNAFDTDPDSRLNQDIGLDGWNNADEQIWFADYVSWIQNNPESVA